MRALLLSAVLFVGAAPLAKAADCHPSRTDFEKVRVGMSYDDVVDALGCEGEIWTTEHVAVAGATVTVYAWPGDLEHDLTFDDLILIGTVDGKVIRMRYGLADP